MKYNLLIVDDEASSRIALSNGFPYDQFGFNLVGQFSNGHTALDFLKQHTIHVLLCDISMPLMNGIELVKILNTWENPPITIFFSGYREFEYARQALSLGVRNYLLKPLKYEDLVQTFLSLKQELDQKYNLSDNADSESNQDNFVTNVHAYVNSNLQTANLKGLADQLYMNSCYVSQLYKEKTGRNFSDYLTEARMKRAAQLLVDSNEKIFTISSMVGYTNVKYFTRAFCSYYAKTPSEYRNSHRIKITQEKTHV